MGLIIGDMSADDLILDGQSVSLYEGGNPPVKLWPTRETVQITLGAGEEAFDQFRAALTARGLDYQTVTEIPFGIELVGSGSVLSMFQECSSLTHVPVMDTSSVTNMSYMFGLCSSLTHVPDLDTSSATDMSGMIYGCSSLTHAPAMDTSSATDMSYMFSGCSSLTHVSDMDTSNVTNMSAMFSECSSLTHVPDLDTSSVTNMSYMFSDCSSLTHVPDLDTSNVTDMYVMFYGCAALTDGNVRLIGRHPDVDTMSMITDSGLTREPFYDTDGNPI